MARHRGYTSPLILTGCVAISPDISSASRLRAAAVCTSSRATPPILVQCRTGDVKVCALDDALMVFALDDAWSIEAGDAMSTFEVFAVDDT